MSYNLFISHSWAYSDTYKDLITLLDEAKYFDYKNYSVPKDNPIHYANNDNQLYNAIKTQMQSVIAKNDFYIPKKIIAIEPWGSEKTSLKVKNNADKIVSRNTSSIVNAIRELG